MVNAWKAHRREIIDLDMPNAKKSISEDADLLTNRQPPYSITGGVFDILNKTKGNMVAIANSQAKQASQLFQKIEGIDIDPAAADALASLIKQVEENDELSRQRNILLNITGGGYQRLLLDKQRYLIDPDFTINTDFDSTDIANIVKYLAVKDFI